MIEVTEIEVMNWEAAIRGMRNPMNSWDKIDSDTCLGQPDCIDCKALQWCDQHSVSNSGKFRLGSFVVGPNDLDLMRRLYRASLQGDNHGHRKFMRQILVSMDINAPRYWWTEFDTYKVGTVANSCSTMHKIHSKEFTIDDFSHDHLVFEGDGDSPIEKIIDILNVYRDKYIKTNNKEYWWQLIQLLPQSYMQKRTVTMNYENAITMIRQRTNHKLDEWNEFVDILWGLPYLKEICKED